MLSDSAVSGQAYPYDLGALEWSIPTESAECQTWFNRGLIWSYGFHHEESEICFRRAAGCDPRAAMAFWGIAYAAGPNYNKAWEIFDPDDLARTVQKCRLAAAESVRLAKTDLEVALAGAIQIRFAEGNEEDSANYVKRNQDYAYAMRKVYDQFAADLNVAALYADSLMALAPWNLWDQRTGRPNEASRTIEIRQVLETALGQAASRTHPGILHLYIHLMELSPTPEVAVTVGDQLRNLCPDAGHLNHMPGHLDLLIGDYRRAIDCNLAAIRADEKYARLGSRVNFYTFYRLHDYSFPIYAGMLSGQLAICLRILDKMESCLTDDFLRIKSPPMVEWNEGFKSYRLHVLIRFGRWSEILALPFPDDPAFYCVTTTMLHYGRGVAYAVLGDIERSAAELALFQDAKTKVPPNRFDFPNRWSDIFAVAEAMLNGELEYRRGAFDLAFAHLRRAINLSDGLIYAEPWSWMQPPRHSYAALKLERGDVEEALGAYAEDLGFNDSLPRAVRHPNNVWALHGYHECLIRLGRLDEARVIKPQLDLALAVADVRISSSCFCRKSCI